MEKGHKLWIAESQNCN